ncbi:hypothetical protein AAVH_10946 [Aphelenchoides avenae]|nr:hypothetical protein AAVH_10946 [Aphelenchus avenae]
MADNEHVYDDDVRRITAAELVPILPGHEGKGFRLEFRIVFKDGRVQHRRADQCTCPRAISEYERLYYRAKLDAAWSPSASPASSKSASKSVASGSHVHADDEATPSKAWQDEGEGSEYADDAHMDNISSDNSLWATYEDSKGRPGTDPEARAAIRKEWAAGDETFKTPKTEGSGSSDQDDVSDHTPKASVKSEALSDDSLAQELKAKGSPVASPGKVLHICLFQVLLLVPAVAARQLATWPSTSRLTQTFEEWAFGRKKIASDPNLPSTSGVQAFKKRKADEDIPAVSQQRRKKIKAIKAEADDNSLPAMPSFPAGPTACSKKAVELVDLTLDEDIFTVDSD